MTATAARSVDGYISVPRVRDGQPVTVDVCYSFHVPTGTLHVSSDWSERLHDWKQHRSYEVAEFGTDWPGRGFRLRKRTGELYDLLLSDDGAQHDTCDCFAGQSHGYCIHKDVLRNLLEQGQI